LDRFTLPKAHLLRKTGEFQRVYRSGQRHRGNGFTVIVMPNTLPWNRLGISVQRKTGNAVRRNRVKRLVREVFRLNRGDFPAHCDVVIAVRPDFSLDSFAALRADIARTLCG